MLTLTPNSPKSSAHDRFVLEEFLDAEAAPLPADARQLESAVRTAFVQRCAVDPHASDAQFRRDRPRMFRIAGPDACRKAVGRVVRDGSRIGLVVVVNDH